MKKALKVAAAFLVPLVGAVFAVVMRRNTVTAAKRADDSGGGEAAKHQGPRSGLVRVDGTSGKVPYRSRTKSELYELAKKFEIPQRSRMSRDELAEALRRRAG